jgi:hypothetical protein
VKKLIFVIFVGLIGLGSFIYKEYSFLFGARNSKELFEKVDRLSCDPNKGQCSFNSTVLGSGYILFKPFPIVLNKKHKLIVKTQYKADRLEADFLGLDIDMGYNRVLLEFKDSFYQANVFLPTCAKERMLWQLSILATDDDKKYATVFKFETVKE